MYNVHVCAKKGVDPTENRQSENCGSGTIVASASACT